MPGDDSLPSHGASSHVLPHPACSFWKITWDSFVWGAGNGGEKGGQTDQDFKASVPALVSLSCFTAQASRSEGTSHLENAGAWAPGLKESWIWQFRR